MAIVDLIYNECGLALASQGLKLPTMAYWAFSFAGGEAEFRRKLAKEAVAQRTEKTRERSEVRVAVACGVGKETHRERISER